MKITNIAKMILNKKISKSKKYLLKAEYHLTLKTNQNILMVKQKKSYYSLLISILIEK